MKSRDALVGAYQDAMESGIGSALQVTWKKKTGVVRSKIILVPVMVQGELLALHFIAPL